MDVLTRRLAIIGASVMVSFSTIFFRLSDSPAMVMTFYRMLFAALIIVPLAVWRCRSGFKEIDRHDLFMSVLSGVVFAVHIAAFFESLNHVSIASCLVLTDTAVFFVALFMMVFFKESVSRREWGIIALTFGGCVLIASSDMSGETGLLGDALALLSSILFAVYAMVGRRVRSKVSTLVYTSILYTSAAITSLIIIAVSDLPSIACGPDDLLLGLGLAVCCTIFGHTVYNWGLRYEKAAFVAITTLLEPVFGAVLGFLIFSEIPEPLVIVGSVIVLLGVYLFSAKEGPGEE
jgi:drug/metabolite transporter (DMT)-like permease